MLIKRTLSKLKNNKSLSLKDFYDKRNKILIVRHARGLGDILMHRMIFEDFKLLMPDAEIIFACPKQYHDAVNDHPYVDHVIDSTNLNRLDYLISYDTSTCCIKWENQNAPFASKHRSDLWAEHCGVTLKKHNMHLSLDPELLAFGNFNVKQLKNNSNAPSVLFTPIAFDAQRTLTDEQIIGTVRYLKNKGYFVYSTHNTKIKILESLGIPVLSGYNLLQWRSFIHAADYVVTADTSVFHYAGGIQKPMCGIFTHADGKWRGRYFDFILVQKHRDNGNWPCGPCYNFAMCTHPKCSDTRDLNAPRPCLTEITIPEIVGGLEKMFTRWAT